MRARQACARATRRATERAPPHGVRASTHTASTLGGSADQRGGAYAVKRAAAAGDACGAARAKMHRARSCLPRYARALAVRIACRVARHGREGTQSAKADSLGRVVRRHGPKRRGPAGIGQSRGDVFRREGAHGCQLWLRGRPRALRECGADSPERVEAAYGAAEEGFVLQ